MSQPSKDIFVDNGIVRSKESNELYCALCTYVRTKKWLSHMEAPSHLRKLEIFNSTFDNLRTSLRCKLCRLNLKWEELQSHAIDHEIEPWYSSVDRYKVFFENQMFEFDNRFYCHPCDKVFPDWSRAFDHIDEETHKKSLQAQKPDDKTLARFDSGEIYKALVNGGLISWEKKIVACKICNCLIIGIKSFHQHIKGSRHRRLRCKFIDHIMEEHCKIAAKRVSDNDVTLKTGKNFYWCGVCERAFAILKQASLHINEDKHKKLQWDLAANDEEKTFWNEPITEEMRKEPLEGATSNRESLLPGYIVQDSDTEFHCAICNFLIDDRETVESHVWSELHSKRREKFNDNKISFKGDNYWQCDCCNYKIYSLDQVFDHIDKNSHKTLLSKFMAKNRF